MDVGIVPTKSNPFERVSGQNVVEMENYILYAQSGKGKPMEWIVEAESLTDFVDHGRYTIHTKPLIRCKDCRWHKTDINQCGRQICAVMYDDDYCNYAERKEVET